MAEALGAGFTPQRLRVVRGNASTGLTVTGSKRGLIIHRMPQLAPHVDPYERDLARLREALARLDRRVADGYLTARQAKAVRLVWAKVSQIEPKPRLPSIGKHEDGFFYLSWNYPEMALSVDIEPDGRVSWFFKDDTAETLIGTEGEPEPELPPLFFTLARLLRQP